MTGCRIGRWALAAAMTALLAAGAALGDRVVMKDGRVFEGTITKETRTSVVIDALVANIRTTLTLSKRDIDSIEKGAFTPPPPPTPRRETPRRAERPRERERAAPSSAPSSGPTRYLVVPIEGTFGEDIGPEGVVETIDFAARRGVDHIVFRVKSPGGYVWAAEEIADAMADAPEDMTLIAYVEEAISASIWVVFGCDEVFMAPGSSVGAAVVFTQDNTTGAAEVDKKMNSALAAKLAAMAEAHGRPGVFPRAMVLPEVEVYAVETEDGGHEIVEERPKRREGVVTIDTRDKVLTLTADEAIRWGVARPATSVEELGEALGLDGWTKHNDFGEAAMRRAGEALAGELAEAKGVVEQIPSTIRFINSNIREAEANDPEAHGYMYMSSGQFTAESIRQWKQRTERCIGAWERVIKGARDLNSLLKKAERYGIDVSVAMGDFTMELQSLADRAGREIDRLRENYNRTSY